MAKYHLYIYYIIGGREGGREGGRGGGREGGSYSLVQNRSKVLSSQF